METGSTFGTITTGLCLLHNRDFRANLCYSQSLSSYTGQPNLISHVGLVKPRPGVFVDDVQYLLVICTPVNVILLGLAAVPVAGTSRNPRTDLKIWATDLVVSTNGNEMTGVVGTKSGRIFMHGRSDGGLYELIYKSQEGWFRDKIELKNHLAGGYSSFLPFLSQPNSGNARIPAWNILH